MVGICDIPVLSTVCDTAGEAAATLVAAPFDWLAQALGGAAAWMIEAMWSVFDSTTLVDVTNTGYVSVYNLLFGIAIFIVLIFFCLQLITGMIKRDPTALGRAGLGVAKAVLGSFVVLTLTALALEIVDQLCIGIVQAAGETTETMGDKIALLAAGLATINIAAPGVGAIVTIFLAGLMIAAVAIVWFSLLIRKVLLLVAIVLAPIAFSGAAWDVTRGWIGKWAAFVIALIVSKLVLVVVFLVAITQVSTPIELDLAAVTDPISGIVLLFVAAFAPYMVYRFISFLGFDIYNQMGTEQEAKNALNQPVPVQGKPQGTEPMKVLNDNGDGGASPPSSRVSGAAGGGAASGEAAGAEAGAAGGNATAAGPAAAVVIGAQVVQKAATAGPELGASIGGQAELATDSAEQAGVAPAPNGSPTTPPPNNPSVPSTTVPPQPSTPQPKPPTPAPAPGSASAPSEKE